MGRVDGVGVALGYDLFCSYCLNLFIPSIHPVNPIRVTKADRQRALGPELDPVAHLMIRAWIRQVVRVEIIDPDDPAPYWVFSVRDAPGLIAALKADYAA